MGDASTPGIDPALLERLRRGLPLRLSAQGHFWFGDEPITHQRTICALRNGLDVAEDGEPIVRVGPQWAYLTVDDCILRATAVELRDGRPWLRLDDGRRAPLDPTTLWEEPGAGLRCRVPSRTTGRPLSVRFTNQAQMDLEPLLQAEGPRPSLRVGAESFVIPDHAPSA